MLRYLAIGDSYTIGEQVAHEQNFPNQTARLLNTIYALQVHHPEIIAITGWTTDELMAAIREKNMQDVFDFVTLLIGVNNQYRGRSVEDYEPEFSALLETAIHFAGGRPDKVFVLSIPDWGVTPFAADRDAQQIAEAIDRYNAANSRIAKAAGCPYLDITESSREHGTDPRYVAEDGLHYSGKEYEAWAMRLAPMIAAAFRQRFKNLLH